jgi:hypothetical protein
MVGWVNSPTADTTTSNTCSAPADVVRCHVRVVAFQRAATTSVRSARCGASP